MARGLWPWIAVLAGACGRFGFDEGVRDARDGDAVTADADTACTDPPTWYEDLDGDEHGNPSAPIVACLQPDGTAPVGDDCDDNQPDRYPGAAEICDGLDNDCSPATVETCLAMCVPLRRPVPEQEHRYLFCGNVETWDVARANCIVQGYHLVTVDDAVENQWLATTATATHATPQQWIGADDLATEGTWMWQDGVEFWQGDASGGPLRGRFSSWDIQEPNNVGGGTGEDCAGMLPDGAWNDLVCISQRHYTCELE